MVLRALPLCAALLASLAACGGRDDGALDVALIGTNESVLTSSLRLSDTAQHVRAATQWGLVALNAQGETVPALAERWIVTDDGLSFIFRLREGNWPDGSAITATSARDALQLAIDGLEGTSLGQDLAPVAEVRAMAGRVIELRLSTPEPYLLQLLAQPELALRQPGGTTGPMTLQRSDDSLGLAFRPPVERGQPDEENWQQDVRPVRLHVTTGREAVALFNSGEAEVVIGGTLGTLPLVETGPLSTGTMRIDPTIGLFGLHVLSDDGILGDTRVREGLAMALDRAALLEQFGIGGWEPTTRPVTPGLPGEPGLVRERWQGEAIEDLRATARARVADRRRQLGDGDLSRPVTLSIALPDAPGWDLFLNELAAQWAGIGVRLRRVDDARLADFLLVDRAARYPAPRWFLNQFNCTLGRGLCVDSVDRLVAAAMDESDFSVRARMLAQAEAEFTLANVYIPIGAPLRWSLVRGTVTGFSANPYGFHPLPDMAQIPS